MNPPSRDICAILEAKNLGFTFGVNLFAGLEPEFPSDCVTVFDIPSGGPISTLDGASDLSTSFVQVRVRNRSYEEAWNLSYEIMKALLGVEKEVWNGTLYEFIEPTEEPGPFDFDENGRTRFITNYNVYRRE